MGLPERPIRFPPERAEDSALAGVTGSDLTAQYLKDIAYWRTRCFNAEDKAAAHEAVARGLQKALEELKVTLPKQLTEALRQKVASGATLCQQSDSPNAKLTCGERSEPLGAAHGSALLGDLNLCSCCKREYAMADRDICQDCMQQQQGERDYL